MSTPADRIRDLFTRTYGHPPHAMAWAPGRVNLIGEHIDYCGGTVLPLTIQQGTFVAIAPNRDYYLNVQSVNRKDNVRLDLEFSVDELLDATHWARYPYGVWQEMTDVHFDLPGFDMLVWGNLPTNGLSSSAALCVACAVAFEASAKVLIPGGRFALAQLAQRVEHRFLGVQCGLMDQAAIALSAPDSALAFNFSTFNYEAVPFSREDPVLLVIDSGRDRHLAEAPYNARQQQVLGAQAALRDAGLGKTVCELSDDDLDQAQRMLTPEVSRRVRHVATEQRRVRTAVAALHDKDYVTLGAAMRQSHESLRDDFEVSCNELDVIVDTACAIDGVYGARLTGAGFGGAAIALLKRSEQAYCEERINHVMQREFGRKSTMFIAKPSGAARLLTV